MINKKCVIKFLVLKTITHSDRKIYSRISNEYKQELLDFLKCYSDLHFKKKGYMNWEYYLISDEDRGVDIRGIIQDVNKETDEIIADLQIMTYKADNFFKYIERNHIPFLLKGLEYYLRLRIVDTLIDDNDVIKQAILSLDVIELKILLNSFSGPLTSLSNDVKNEQITLFRNELIKIYSEMKTFLKNK